MAVTRQDLPGARETEEEKSTSRRRLRSREALLVALSATAVLLAAVGAIGPAAKKQATYSWPPQELPAEQPRQAWYAPLLVNRHVADSLDVVVPCRASTPLPGATRPLTILATARREATGGLTITRAGDRLRFAAGPEPFASIALPSGAQDDGSCAVALHFEGSRWTIDAPGTRREGAFETAPPVVTGFFSGVDLRRGGGPAAELSTLPFRAEPLVRQTLAWIAAVLCALCALVLAVAPRWRRPRLRSASTRAWRSLRLVDGFVALALAIWWIVGPLLFDDGWVKARQSNYEAASGFSNYYTTFGANLPLDFWVEWVQHWVIGSFASAAIVRIPAIALAAATWIICRWALSRILTDGVPSRTGAEWALAVAYVLNVFAWSFTLRPESAMAPLVVGVLACAVRFTERPGAGSLAVASVLVALALTAHPAGLVSLAPLIVISPRIVDWARRERWLVPLCIALSGLALLIVLFTVGADVFQRVDEARMARTVGDANAGWREELTRYQFRGAEGTTLRRASIALMLVAVLAYLLRRDRKTRFPLDLPAASLGVALLLLIPTPSKWAWHFGALAGLAALAVAAEVVRLMMRSGVRSPVAPLLALVAAILVVGYGWSPRENWASGLDLRTYSWTLAIEDRLPLVRLMAASPAIVLVAAVLIILIRRGRNAAWNVPWRLVPWLVPLAVLPLLAFNLVVLTWDAVKTPEWSFPRQNLSSLVNAQGCGLADDTRIAVPRSMRPLPSTTADGLQAARPTWIPPPPLSALDTFTTLREGDSRVETPWFRRPEGGRRVGFFVSSAAAAVPATIEARWGVSDGSTIRPGDWQPVAVSAPNATRTDSTPWSFIAEGALPSLPTEANAVQLAVTSAESPPRALAATGAVSYRSERLARLLSGPTARTLVWPNLVLYMPCATLPRLERGIVETPTAVVAHRELWAVESPNSPFQGILDLYRLRDVSTGDSPLPPAGVHVLWVDENIPGAVLAPAEYRGEG